MIRKISHLISNYLKNNLWRILFALIFIITFHLTWLSLTPPLKVNYPSYSNFNFSVFGLNIPRNLSFCGEKIPTNDYALKDNLENEFYKNKHWKQSAGYLYSKAQKWFPYIEPILKEEGVPDDFKYVAVIESHLTNARSTKGAAGFWQLVPSTARNYGLIVNDDIDERLDVEKSTHAACKLVKSAYKIFGNWTLTAAAYNLGIGGVQRRMKEQNSNNYYDLVLNKETGSFVYRILAYKTLFSEPKHFGIKRKSIKYFPKIPMKVIKVDSSIIDIKFIAKKLKVNIAIVKLFNPWLLKEVVENPTNRVFEFKIPKKINADYSNYYADLLEQKSVVIDSSTNSEGIIIENIDTNEFFHHIFTNESISEVAATYRVSVNEILEWNNFKREDQIPKGFDLIIKKNKAIESEK